MRAWQPTPVVLPGESYGQGAWRAIVHGVTKELDATEHACNLCKKLMTTIIYGVNRIILNKSFFGLYKKSKNPFQPEW